MWGDGWAHRSFIVKARTSESTIDNDHTFSSLYSRLIFIEKPYILDMECGLVGIISFYAVKMGHL
jgi:hypothetical protein